MRIISLSVDDTHMRKLYNLMARHHIDNRSRMFRTMLDMADMGLAGSEPVIDGTGVAGLARREIAGMAGMEPPVSADYPGMGITAYDLALAAARSHSEEILGGVIPMTYEDAVSSGLDPHGRQAWELYHTILPRFFRTVWNMRVRPVPDMRYEPLNSVNGQYMGSICGEVLSRDCTYPDGNTTRYEKLAVRTATQNITVLVPGMPPDIAPGVNVYAAGIFVVVRQKVVMRACKCHVVRGQWEAIYGLTGEWGLGDGAAAHIIRMLKRRHGADAPKFAEPFASFARLDCSSHDLSVMMPDSKCTILGSGDVRATPPGPEAVKQCIKLWARVVWRL